MKTRPDKYYWIGFGDVNETTRESQLEQIPAEEATQDTLSGTQPSRTRKNCRKKSYTF